MEMKAPRSVRKTASCRACWPPASVYTFQAVDVSAVTGSAAADSTAFTAGQLHARKSEWHEIRLRI